MKNKTYIVTEQFTICFMVEAKNQKEAREKYSDLSHADFQDLVYQAIDDGCGSINVEEDNK